MKPKVFVFLGVCLTVASLLFTTSTNQVIRVGAEPLSSHSVNEAFQHALTHVQRSYNLPGLTTLTWQADVDNHPDLAYATHHVFVNKAEMLSELQAQYALTPAHSGYRHDQLTVIVHAPDDQRLSHKVTIINAEQNVVWSGKIDVDGHVTEYQIPVSRLSGPTVPKR